MAKRENTFNDITDKREWDTSPKHQGHSVCTYVGINFEHGGMYGQVVERLIRIREITECHFVTGPFSMLVKLYARDNRQLMDLLNNQLQTIPGVASTETFISLDQSIGREYPIKIEI